MAFAQREGVRDFKERVSIFGQLFVFCWPALFAAFAMVAVFELAWLSLVASFQCAYATRMIGWATGVSGALALNATTVDSLLSVIASVCGVFLALYFTAIAIVAQTGFATAPDTVRGLLLKEKAGNLYLRVLTVLVCFTLILLGLHALGYQSSPLSILAALLLGVFGVISFMALGFRAFYFFDPSKLATVVASDFLRNARLASSDGYRWHDRAFQAHYHKLAVQDLTRAQNLVAMCVQGAKMSPEGADTVLQHLIVMMGIYAKMKRRIPTDSHWYAQTPQHRNWFLQDHTPLDMAIRTQTAIQPVMVADHSWVESRFLAILVPTWSAMLKEGQTDVLHRSLSAFATYMEHLGADANAPQAGVCLRSLWKAINEHYAALNASTGPEKLEDLAVLEMLVYCSISLAVGFFRHVRDGDPGRLIEHLSCLDWHDPLQLYCGAIPASVLGRAEQISRGIGFEHEAEGRTISPTWYLRQLGVVAYCDSLQANFEEVIKSFSDLSEIVADWSKRNSPTIAAFLAYRALELHFKIRGNIPHIQAAVDSLRACETYKGGGAAPWDWSAFDRRIEKIHAELVHVLAQSLPGLSPEQEVSERPDFFGQTYHAVCRFCFEAMRDNRADEFTLVFPHIFSSALRSYGDLSTLLKDRPRQQAVAWASEPLLDIMALSGYARMYADLHHNHSFWDACHSLWLQYLADRADPHAVVGFLIACQDLRRTVFSLFPRDILRTGWSIVFDQSLRDAGLGPRREYCDSAPHHTGETAASPLLRAYCRYGHHSGRGAVDVFIVTMLLRHPSAKGIDYQGGRLFASALGRETASEEQK